MRTPSFEINGTNYTGSAGLDALAAAGAGTVTAAFGTLTTATREFDAASVFAGTSVPGAGVDTVMGEVISRAGDVLTVRGATVVRDSDGAHFARGNVRVTIGPNTKVVKGGTWPSPTAAEDHLGGPVDRSVRRGYAGDGLVDVGRLDAGRDRGPRAHAPDADLSAS